MIDLGKQNILGVRIDAVDYEGAIERIKNAARVGAPLSVSALAVHGVMTGVLDNEHRFRLNCLDLIVPDGQPVRWALNWLYRSKLKDRVYGPNLMLKVCEQCALDRLPIFLYGGTEDLLDKLAERLREKFPQLEIAGTRPSKFRCLNEDERDEAVDAIQASGARVTFVGLGCPRQEVWAYEFRDAVSMPILAVGAAFNFHAGLLDQAPPKMQKRGLEWLYRLVKEPRRLWKRYLLLNPLYASLLLLQASGLRRFDPNSAKAPKRQILYG